MSILAMTSMTSKAKIQTTREMVIQPRLSGHLVSGFAVGCACPQALWMVDSGASLSLVPHFISISGLLVDYHHFGLYILKYSNLVDVGGGL